MSQHETYRRYEVYHTSGVKTSTSTTTKFKSFQYRKDGVTTTENVIKKDTNSFYSNSKPKDCGSPRSRRRKTHPPSAKDCIPDDSTLLVACRDENEAKIQEIASIAKMVGVKSACINYSDQSGRTGVSHLCASGNLGLLQNVAEIPGLNINKADSEGNVPLHYATQAGHADILSFLLNRWGEELELDARNMYGFTPLMKAAVQGRAKCAKLLMFAGASATLRDFGRGLSALEWAKFCSRNICAEIIESFLTTTPEGRMQSCQIAEAEEPPQKPVIGEREPWPAVQELPVQKSNSWFKTKFRKATQFMSKEKRVTYTLATNLSSAAICASSAAVPSGQKTKVKVQFIIPTVQLTPADSERKIVVYKPGEAEDAQQPVPSVRKKKETFRK